MLCVEQIGADLGDWVRAVCGTVWCGFGGGRVCCVWESLVWVWGSECLLCAGQFGVGLWGVSVCCV